MSMRLSSVLLFVAVFALSASAVEAPALVLSVSPTTYGTPVQAQFFAFNAPTDSLGTVNCIPKLDGRNLAAFDVPSGASPSNPYTRTISSPALSIGQHTLSVYCEKKMAGLITTWSASADASFTVGGTEAACTDTDGGINYPVKGVCTSGDTATGSVTGEDYCADNALNTLNEFYCSQSSCMKETHVCPNGCADGACLSAAAKPVRVCKTFGGTETPEGEATPLTINLGSFKQVGDILIALEDIAAAGNVKITISNKATGVISATVMLAVGESVVLGGGKRIKLIAVKTPPEPELTPSADFEIYADAVSGGVTYCLVVSSPIRDYVYPNTPVSLTFEIVTTEAAAAPTASPQQSEFSCTYVLDANAAPMEAGIVAAGSTKTVPLDVASGTHSVSVYCVKIKEAVTEALFVLETEMIPFSVKTTSEAVTLKLPEDGSVHCSKTVPWLFTISGSAPSYECAGVLNGVETLLAPADAASKFFPPNSKITGALTLKNAGAYEMSVKCREAVATQTSPWFESPKVRFTVLTPDKPVIWLPLNRSIHWATSVEETFEVCGSYASYECRNYLDGQIIEDASAARSYEAKTNYSLTLSELQAGQHSARAECRGIPPLVNAGGRRALSFAASVTGTYRMEAYVGGYLDVSVPDDKSDSWTGDIFKAGRKVTNSETPLAYKGTVSDIKASKSYTEEERYYFYSNIYSSPAYGTSGTEVMGKNTRVGYEIQFTDPIPVCTNAKPSQATCTSKEYESARHHIKIKFLGADWIIYGMKYFEVAGGGADGVAWTTTPKVTLGKEVAYNPFMSINDEITALNGIKIKLVSFSSGNKVTFKIYNSAGTEIDTAILQPTEEYNKNGIVLYLYNVTTGIAGTSSAEVSIFSEKLELTHNSVVNADNPGWRVVIVGGGPTFGASLARIQLQNIADVPTLRVGESFGIIKSPTERLLTFLGLKSGSNSVVQFAFSEGIQPSPTPLTPSETGWVSSDTTYFETRTPDKPIIWSPIDGTPYYAPLPLTFEVGGRSQQYSCKYSLTKVGGTTTTVDLGTVPAKTNTTRTISGLTPADYTVVVSCAGVTGTTQEWKDSDTIQFSYKDASQPFINKPVISSPVNKVYYDQTTIDLNFSVSGSFLQYACSRKLNDGESVSLGSVNNAQSTNFPGNLTGLELGQTYEVSVTCTAGSLSATASVPFRVEHWTGEGSGGTDGSSGGADQGGWSGTDIWGNGTVKRGAGAASPTPKATATLMPSVAPTTPRGRTPATMLSLDCPKTLSAPTAEFSASLLASGKAACDNSLTTTVTINGTIPGTATFIVCSSGLHRVVVDTGQGGDYVIKAYSPAYDVAAQCVFKNGVLVEAVPEMSLLLVVLAGAGAFYALSRKKR